MTTAIDKIVFAIETLNKTKKRTPAHDRLADQLAMAMAKVTYKMPEKELKKRPDMQGLIRASAEAISKYKKR